MFDTSGRNLFTLAEMCELKTEVIAAEHSVSRM